MTRRLMLLTVVLGVTVLALAGVLRDATITRAHMPLAVQPWNPDTDIKVDTTALGAGFMNGSFINVPFGTRIANTYWYNRGIKSAPDKDITDGLGAGGLIAKYDLLCNAAGPTDIDTLADKTSSPPTYVRESWQEAPTGLVGSLDAFLLSAGPPYPAIWRLNGTIDTFFTSGGTSTDIPVPIALNLMAYVLPWFPGTSLTYVQIAGDPAPPSTTCQDSTANSDSHILGDIGSGTNRRMMNPPPVGDSGSPCRLNLSDGIQCADKQIHGFWAGETILKLAHNGSTLTPIPVTKRVLNSGPEVGSFVDVWDIELPPSGLTASWVTNVDQSNWNGTGWTNVGDPTVSGSGVLISFPEDNLPLSLPIQYVGGLNLTCTADGDYLVTLKNFTYPKVGTVDNDLSANMALFTMRVICAEAAEIEMDKRIILVRKTLITLDPADPNFNLLSGLPQDGEHVQLFVGQKGTVSIDSTQINLSSIPDTSLETMVAEAPPGITVAWVAHTSPPYPDPDTVIPGGLRFAVDEPAGTEQIDVVRDLNITCTQAGIFPVAVKVIDAPIGVAESKPADNAAWNVITVWCRPLVGDPPAPMPDTVDDASGLLPRWTVLAPDSRIPEIRKSFDPANPVLSALRSDTTFIERLIDLECFWMDTDGAPNQNGDVFSEYSPAKQVIDDWESQLDPNRPYGLDDDQDCLADSAFAQPNHPVDEIDSKDTDGDGVSDFVETILGSDPTLAAKVPEATLGPVKHVTCTDGLNNDGDASVGDSDAECAITDTDGDGWVDWFEIKVGPAGAATNAAITPESLAAPTTCQDNKDNDGDGQKDGADSGCVEPDVAMCAAGTVGGSLLHNVHVDEDCDGLVDGVEKGWGSNPMLADTDSDGATDFQEMFMFTNPTNPDTDGDGLLDKSEDDYTAAPAGGAANSVPETALAGNCADGIDNDTDGRIDWGTNPLTRDPNCDPTNSDGDSFADVDERALDSNPYDTAKTTEATIAAGTCSDNIDNDGDGKKDGADYFCLTADDDGDGASNNVELALGSVAYSEAGEATSDDNCPYVYNPDQANNDGRPEANGPFVDRAVRSMFNADTLGDVCDSDDDNDGALDVYEVKIGTNPFKRDTDGDGCTDGAELLQGKAPLDPAIKCSPLSSALQSLARTCHVNMPNQTLYPDYSPGYSGSPEVENDIDNDGSLCPYASGSGDKDADNGSSKLSNACAFRASPPSWPCTEIEDNTEVRGYGTYPSNPDSDGDACEDGSEIADINGSRQADSLDTGQVQRRVAGLLPADPVSDAVFDANKNGAVETLDVGVVQLNANEYKPGSNCGTATTDALRSLP